MGPDKAKKLGQYLRRRREKLGLSSRQLGARCGLKDATIVRIELGEFANPSPDKLARLADTLGLPLADVFALAEYSAPRQLPSFQPYLRTKYRDMPPSAVNEMQRLFDSLELKYGFAGPGPGEDEQPEGAPAKPTRAKSTSPRRGGAA